MSDPKFILRPLPEPGVNLDNLVSAKVVNPALLKFPFPIIPLPVLFLGPLSSLPGTWKGTGFNMIWRPVFPQTDTVHDTFLELNRTTDQIVFSESIGAIPNRGFFQKDIVMHGLTYMQNVGDSNVNAGLHVEPGIWAVVPPTTSPNEPATVVRMASIPHGTTLLAQGLSSEIAGPPTIPSVDITPFAINNPGAKFPKPMQILSDLSDATTKFRSPPAQLVGITQAMLNNPNSVLTAALAGQTITHTTVLTVSSDPTQPVTGGGTANTAFLAGAPVGHNPNAVAIKASSTFWIETVKGQAGKPDFLQLQYTQNVLLNFGGLSWPHVSVGTLLKQ